VSLVLDITAHDLEYAVKSERDYWEGEAEERKAIA
jgi:hypothetical protein